MRRCHSPGGSSSLAAQSANGSCLAIADGADQTIRYPRAYLVPVFPRCLPLRGRAIVFQLDGIDSVSQAIEGRIVRVASKHPNVPVAGIICGYVVEKFVPGDNPGFFIFLEYGD